METIKYKRTWCDYLTPCPYLNKNNDPSGIMVGDYECDKCPYNKDDITDYSKGEVVCSYKEEHQDETHIS